MKTLTNIEKLPGKKHYTGYANGVWKIEKEGKQWRAFRRDDFATLYAPSLTILSEWLTKKA